MERPLRDLDGHYRTEDAVVSVWLGTFPDPETCDNYVSVDWDNSDADAFPKCHFWQDLGILWFDHDFEESRGYLGDPVPVAELLGRGWSYVESFRTPLLEACRAKRVDTANIVLFLFEFDYPVDAGYSCPYMTFMGVFPYRKDA